MLSRVALAGTGISEEPIASIIMVTRIGELGTTLAVTSNRITLEINACHPNDVGATLLRKTVCYKSHTE
jgi:hypothetical protein